MTKKKRPKRVRPADRFPLVYRYGALRPSAGLDVIEEQFRLAHRYRNKLVELELARREAVNQALRRMGSALCQVEEQLGAKAQPAQPADHERGIPATPPTHATGMYALIAAAEAAVKQRHVRERGRQSNATERAHLSALRQQKKELEQRRKELRTELFESPAWEAEQARINQEAKAALLAARAASGLYWGTYEQVEQAAKAFSQGRPPRFRPWGKRKDKLCVRVKGMTLGELFSGDDNQISLTLSQRPRAQEGSRRGRERLQGTITMRVGRDKNAKATIPIVYHRPLPTDAELRLVYLVRRTVGTHSQWNVQFALETAQRPARAESGAVGVDVGWRIMPDGRLRVAVTAGGDGDEFELALPPWWLAGMRTVERIQGERDRLLDVIKPLARQVIDLAGEAAPVWVREAGPRIWQWRSKARLVSLVLRWQQEQPTLNWTIPVPGHEALRSLFANPDTIPVEPWVLRAWQKRDKHLFDYEANLRAQLQDGRRNMFREFASRLAQQYATVVIEDLDLRDFHRLPNVEEGGSKEEDALRAYVRWACLHELINALKHRCQVVLRVNPEFTTMRCHACREIDTAWTDHAGLMHTCPSCRAKWDQDRNAARNILRDGTTGANGPGPAWPLDPVAPTEVMSYHVAPALELAE